MGDLFLAFGVILNSISILILQIQIIRLRRERGFRVGDLKSANSIQSFDESMNEKGCSVDHLFVNDFYDE